jgi:hypothetical protein
MKTESLRNKEDMVLAFVLKTHGCLISIGLSAVNKLYVMIVVHKTGIFKVENMKQFVNFSSVYSSLLY